MTQAGPSPRTSRRPRAAVPVLSVVVLLAAQPDLQVDYVLTQAVYQAGMLLGRVPVDDVVADQVYGGKRAARLALADDVRRFALDEIGLAPLKSYTAVSVGFERKMYNVMACAADRFEARRHWFPIVGTIPYIGYFRLADARREQQRLLDAGYDVYARPVGAYSSLGWFDDPLLPGMLDWPEYRLADTLIHESAHATLFLPGQMRFNESYARFVGNEGAERFMELRRAVAPAEYRRAHQTWHDRALMKGFMASLYGELDGLYERRLSRGETLAAKADVLAAARRRYEQLPFERTAYRRYFERRKVNNATLYSYRTYNSGDPGFEAMLAACDDDLGCFVERMQALEGSGEDGFEWLARETGIEENGTPAGPYE